MPEDWLYPDWHPYYAHELRARMAQQAREALRSGRDTAPPEADEPDPAGEPGSGEPGSGGPGPRFGS